MRRTIELTRAARCRCVLLLSAAPKEDEVVKRGSQWTANAGDRFDEGACRVLKLPSPTSPTARGRFAGESTLSLSLSLPARGRREEGGRGAGKFAFRYRSNLPGVEAGLEGANPTWAAIIETAASLDNCGICEIGDRRVQSDINYLAADRFAFECTRRVCVCVSVCLSRGYRV